MGHAAMKDTQIRRWMGLIIMLAAIILYTFTLDNGLRPDELTGGDLITHQYAQVEGRPSNAPGYPLYTMGGWLWFRLGRVLLGWVFNPLQILSFYSTLWGLASLLLLYLILLRIVGRRWWPAPLLTAFYASTFFFWYYSVTTEQYTSAVCQTLLLIWLAFKWDDAPQDSTLLALAFVSGTMLANMVTTLFILPPLLWFIFFRRSADQSRWMLLDYLKRPGLIIKAVIFGLLPLLSYAYIYIRGAQHPEWRGVGQWPSTWAWFIQFLTIQQGRDELAPGLNIQNLFTDEFPALIWHELTWPVFWGGLIGLIFLGQRRAIFLTSTLIIYLIFSWGYRFGNWFQVIMPAYPIFVIGFAAGIRQLIEAIENWKMRRLGDWEIRSSSFVIRHSSFVISNLIAILLFGLFIYRITTNFPAANQHNQPEDTGLDPGWAILADQPRPPAHIVTVFEERVALQYLRTVWGVAAQLIPVDVDAMDDAAQAGQNGLSFYATRQAIATAPEILKLEIIHPQAAGEQLIELRTKPRTDLPVKGTVSLDLPFGDHLKLKGWEFVENEADWPEAASRATWQIALYWQTSALLVEDYTVSVRPLVDGQLINRAGENLIQDHQPVWGVYPTSKWRPGEIVRDVYALELPSGICPDAVQVVIYHATTEGFENLGEQTISLDQTPSDPLPCSLSS